VFARLAAALVAAAALGLSAGAPAAAAPNFRISSGTMTDDFFGESIGVDFRAGRLVAGWADNGEMLAGNPDRPALDVAFAGVAGGVVGGNVNVTQSPLSQFGVSLAVDPTDPDTAVLAALGGGASPSGFPTALRALSRDGGATWTVVRGLPSNFGSFSPSVAFDAFGNCFLALVHDPTFGNPRLELFVSTDGGATFDPVAVPDPAGLETNVSVAAGFGAVWLAFESYDGTVRIKSLSAPVTAAGQVGTFTLQTLPDSLDGRRPDVALRPGGAAAVAYGDGAFTQTPTVSVQLDGDGLGGAGFGLPIPVANVPGYPNLPRPKLAVDGSSGRIYLVYPDRQEGNGPEEIRLNFSEAGTDWSAALTVNDPVASRDRELPEVAVDDSGAIGIAWYDFRNGGAQLWGDVREQVQAPAQPRAPLNLVATAVSQSRIDLAWTDTSDNEQGFQIERRTGNPFEQPVIVATLPANATSFSHVGLPADTGFGYRVRAFNAAGASLWSNGASATTLPFPPPAPQELTATAITFQRIDLEWRPVVEADSYEVQQSTDGVAFTTITRPTATEMMIFGLQSSTTYFFRVRSVNSGGESSWSNVASATTLAENQPAAPTELRAVALSKSRILIEWRDNSVNETRFEIQRSSGGGPFANVGRTNANAQSFLDSGLRRATTYTYRVRACSADACSPFSNAASAATPG
jgi:Fibronectin type III domain